MIKYLPSHEYVRTEDNKIAYIGITPYAASQLGNVVYVDMPAEDEEIAKGEEFGAIESVKAASDLYSPVSGIVVEVNAALEDDPGLINKDPMANWIIRVEMSDPSELDDLLDEAAYTAACESEKH